MKRNVFIIFIFFMYLAVNAQDKIILNNGKTMNGVVISVAGNTIFYKTSDTSARPVKIPKSEVIMVEKYNGTVYLFTKENSGIKDTNGLKSPLFRNSLCFQPGGVFFGRAPFAFERLSKDGKIGYVIPVILTFDPVGTLYKDQADSSNFNRKHYSGVNFISGLDINFYIGQKETQKFYIGPRIRYGVDMFLENTEAYSLQTQFGWKKEKPGSRFVQHLSFGFGFVRVLSIVGTNSISSKQSFGWGSITYKLGFKW